MIVFILFKHYGNQTQIVMKKLIILIIVSQLFISCGNTPLEKASAEIEEFKRFITERQRVGQNHVSEWIESLEPEVREILEDHLVESIGNASAIASINAQCGVENTLKAVLNELDQIKIKIGIIKVEKITNPLKENNYCQGTTPNLNLDSDYNNTFQWYGTHWNKDKLKLEWVNDKMQRNDITEFLHIPSRFTINIAVRNLLQFKNEKIRRLILTDTKSNKILAEHPVIYKPNNQWTYFMDGNMCGIRGYTYFRIMPQTNIKRVSAIKFWEGKYIDAVQLVYETDKGKSITSQKYGGEGGNMKETTLAPGEKIKNMTIRYGSIIDQIWINTNLQSNIHNGGYGGSVNCNSAVPNDYEFIGLEGWYGRYKGPIVLSKLKLISRKKID